MHSDKNHKKYITKGWAIGMLLMAFPVLAQAPSPSQDFFEYMIDFEDANDEVLDPLEYEQWTSLKSEAVADSAEAAVLDASEQNDDEPSIKNDDVTLNTQFSAKSSSSVMKGVTL